MSEKTLLFKVLSVFDFMLNVLTGGGAQTYFSTRAYYREQTSGLKRWRYIRQAVDIIMFEKEHCKKSYYWEVSRKQKWLIEHSLPRFNK